MKVIICGSRSIQLYSLIAQAVKESGFTVSEVVCGCAEGADKLGHLWARRFLVPVRFFPAWGHQEGWALLNRSNGEIIENHMGKHGKAAGFIRNEAMAQYADALIAIRANGGSKGTDDMIQRARKHGLKVWVKEV